MPKGPNALPFERRYVVTTAGCWEWVGYVDRDGRGQFHNRSSRRCAWEMARGPIPPGKVLYAAVCRSSRCIRPDHMLAVTPQGMHDLMPVHGHTDSRGEMSGKAKLTAEAVLFIRSQPRVRGIGPVLGRLYGIGARYVSSIRARKTWRHLGNGNKANAMPLAQLRALANQRALERTSCREELDLAAVGRGA